MRRTLSLLLVAAVVAAAAWLALRKTTEDAAWPARLTYAAGIVPRGLNPLLDRNGWNEVSSVVLGRLVRPDHRGGIEGDLAESWTVSEDGRQYTMELRGHAFWHDGAPFTSDDVLFTWQRLFDPATDTTLDGNQALLESFRADGPHRFVFELRAADTGFLAAVTEIGILPAHLLRDADINGDAFERNPVGTGPFRIVRQSPETQWSETLLARHDRFHLGRPAFAEMLIRVIAHDDARADAIAAGAADLGQIKPPHVEPLRAAGRRVYRMSTGAWRAMPLNTARPALADRRVRQAIDLGIDRKAIVAAALGGYGEAGYSPIPPASWAFRPEMNRPRHDPTAAERLLDAAGWRRAADGRRMRGGEPLTLEVIVWKDEFFRRTAAEMIASQLGALGFTVNLHRVDGTTYNRLAEAMGTTYDTFIGGWGSLLDPGDNLYKKYHSRGSQNRTGYADSQVDAWLEAARSAPDREAAIPLYLRIVERVTEAAVFLPVAYPEYVFAARAELAGIEDYTLDSWYEFTKYAAEWAP
jgi:peptide/nickel transport system substrate-binding protein